MKKMKKKFNYCMIIIWICAIRVKNIKKVYLEAKEMNKKIYEENMELYIIIKKLKFIINIKLMK